MKQFHKYSFTLRDSVEIEETNRILKNTGAIYSEIKTKDGTTYIFFSENNINLIEVLNKIVERLEQFNLTDMKFTIKAEIIYLYRREYED